MNDAHDLTRTSLVSIVMAVYHPKENWLIQQLESLNRQTYKNIEIIICDDGPDTPVNLELFQKCITKFPWRIVSNSANLGSSKTFERLTAMAEGKYIAYCDQDDIWEDNKIELMVNRIKKTGAVLCCSDLSMIDENGKFIADSITKVRKRHVFKEGAGLAPKLIVRNFVTGCAMIIKTETAKAAIPFEEYMVHDHWLALFSALHGEIAFEPIPTVKYRQHQSNQTSVLTGIHTKEDYDRIRIETFYKRIFSLRERFCANEKISAVLDEISAWTFARKDYYEKPSIQTAKIMWAGREFDKHSTLFELLMPLIPAFLFKKVIDILR